MNILLSSLRLIIIHYLSFLLKVTLDIRRKIFSTAEMQACMNNRIKRRKTIYFVLLLHYIIFIIVISRPGRKKSFARAANISFVAFLIYFCTYTAKILHLIIFLRLLRGKRPAVRILSSLCTSPSCCRNASRYTDNKQYNKMQFFATHIFSRFIFLYVRRLPHRRHRFFLFLFCSLFNFITFLHGP